MRRLGRVLGLLAIVCGAIAHAQFEPTTPVPLAVKGINAIGDDLLRDFRKNGNEGNLVFSPFSVSAALAIVYAGAKGETAEEIRKAMHFPEFAVQTHQGYRELVSSLDQSDILCKVQCSNGLFSMKDYQFRPNYLALLKQVYRAQAAEFDHRRDADQAIDTINGWIARATAQRIPKMVLALAPSARLVSVNTLYFSADWHHRFREGNTKSAPFSLLSGRSIQVHMMYQTTEFRYFSNSLLQVVEIPYEGKQYSMVVLLPRRTNGLTELEKHFVDGTLGFGMGNLKPRNVRLYMPRFEIDSGTMDLVPTLRRLGTKRLFSPKEAELGGISEKPGLYVDEVLHRTCIRVNEQGTEAAASTVAEMELMEADASNPVLVRMNHPFLFFLRDRKTNATLFIGRVTEPTEVIEIE